MAAIVGAVMLANIVGAATPPMDVESDLLPSQAGVLNVHVDTMRGGASTGYIVVPVSSAVLATLVDGPCSIVVSQGAGTVTQIVTQ